MRRAFLLCLMIALLSPPLAAFGSQTTVPHGVARVGAANEGTEPLDYSHIGVAVIDTGINLENPDLNVVGGVDCAQGAGTYASGNVEITGAQKSIWEPIPDDEGTSGPPHLTTPSTAEQYPRLTEAGVLNLSGIEFEIQSLENPAHFGGRDSGAEGYEDGNGHGTHVAGTIAARDDGQGVVGVAPNASLYAVRVLDDNGGGNLDTLVCGLDWVAANAADIHVANMSLGAHTGMLVMDTIEACDAPDAEDLPPFVQRTEKLRDELHEAVCRVVEAGVVLVVAAGNGWGDAGTVVPAAYPEVIAVSSFADFDGKHGGYGENVGCPERGGTDDAFYTHLNGAPGLGMGSFGGESVDIAAPGVCVLSTVGLGVEAFTGTSMATPHVTGTVARIVGDNVLLEANRDVAAIRAALMERAQEQPATFRDADDWAEPLVSYH